MLSDLKQHSTSNWLKVSSLLWSIRVVMNILKPIYANSAKEKWIESWAKSKNDLLKRFKILILHSQWRSEKLDQSNLPSCRRPKVFSTLKRSANNFVFVIAQHPKTVLLFIDEIELKTKAANGDDELLKVWREKLYETMIAACWSSIKKTHKKVWNLQNQQKKKNLNINVREKSTKHLFL